MSKFTSLCLKTIGAILIISFFVDCLTIPIAFEPLEPQWQISVIGEIVDRGIIPMVGMAFMMVGFFLDSNAGKTTKSAGSGLKLPVFLLSLVLGFVFLVFVPLYLNNLRLYSTEALTRIEEGAGEAENRISQRYEQLNEIATNPQRLQSLENTIRELNNAISSGQFQGRNLNAQELQRLQQETQRAQSIYDIAKDPEVLEQRILELQTQLRDQKLERENIAKTRLFKQGIRTGLSSLLLSIGYLVMGWFGLQGTNNNEAKTKKSQATASR